MFSGLAGMHEVLNLLAALPAAGPAEHLQVLLARPGLRVERIISDGQVSPPGFWYEQPEDEWVLVLQGAGSIEYADGRRVALGSGDSLLIPAHCRHRVAETAPRTVWLAIFCVPESS